MADNWKKRKDKEQNFGDRYNQMSLSELLDPSKHRTSFRQLADELLLENVSILKSLYENLQKIGQDSFVRGYLEKLRVYMQAAQASQDEFEKAVEDGLHQLHRNEAALSQIVWRLPDEEAEELDKRLRIGLKKNPSSLDSDPCSPVDVQTDPESTPP